jgi:AAA+ ATPase superfamily predicted ATPase
MTDKGIVITGLRGVGKTVLLERFSQISKESNAVVIKYEVAKDINLGFTSKFPSLARKALLEIAPTEKWKGMAFQAAGVISGFKAQFDPNGQWSFSYDIMSAKEFIEATGKADSGDFVYDLPDLLEVLGAAMKEHGKTLVILIDEVQELNKNEITALIMAKQRINQNSLPIVLAVAGLPQTASQFRSTQAYVERMFSWPDIGGLDKESARKALLEPIFKYNIFYEADAVDYIIDYTEGYPYFLQEFGKTIWNQTLSSPITLIDATRATSLVNEVLDQDFFSIRVAELNDREKNFIKALASLGAGEHTAKEVAIAMNLASSAGIGKASQTLINKGLIYNTKRGNWAFTVPQFDKYVTRKYSL